MTDTLLQVIGLKTYFHTRDGLVKAVDDVSFAVQRGETLGVVGESGCGKSVTSLSIMQLIQGPRGRIEDGEIWFSRKDGSAVEITKLHPHVMRCGRLATLAT